MIEATWATQYEKEFPFRILPLKFYIVFYWVLPTIWVALLLIGYHFYGHSSYPIDDLRKVFMIETSFPVFLLLTWLLPQYFLRRYIRRLETANISENK